MTQWNYHQQNGQADFDYNSRPWVYEHGHVAHPSHNKQLLETSPDWEYKNDQNYNFHGGIHHTHTGHTYQHNHQDEIDFHPHILLHCDNQRYPEKTQRYAPSPATPQYYLAQPAHSGAGGGHATTDFHHHHPQWVQSDLNTRLTYSGQVYGILALILMTLFATVAIFYYSLSWRQWCVDNPAFFVTTKGLTLICIFPLICCQTVRRTFPVNVVFLAMFTLSLGFSLAQISVSYNSSTLPLAIGTSALMALMLVAFSSCQREWEITQWSLGLVPTAIIILYGIFAIFLASFPKIQLLYAGMLTLAFMLMTIFFVYRTTPQQSLHSKGTAPPHTHNFVNVRAV